MRRIGLAGSFLVAALAISAVVAMSASAALPEFGKCVETTVKHTGEYSGPRCISLGGMRKYNWMPEPVGETKFSINLESVVIGSTGASKSTISCPFALGQAEYTGPKTVKVTKLVFSNCQKLPEEGFTSWCQNAGEFRGEIAAKELIGEIGYIPAKTPATQVGLDLKPASGSILAMFECGGANELTEHGMGTGIFREIEGSVIGHLLKINSMLSENVVKFVSKKGTQVPEQFEGGVKDTLTTLVGLTEKTPEPTTLAAVAEIANEAPVEVKTK